MSEARQIGVIREVDKNGRIQLPAQFRRAAGITGKVELFFYEDRLEVKVAKQKEEGK